jgi:Flp pilus assembly protein TadD
MTAALLAGRRFATRFAPSRKLGRCAREIARVRRAATAPRISTSCSRALKAAPDADSAKLVEGSYLGAVVASGSDTTDLLMSRVKTAIDGKDTSLAIELLGAVIGLKPDYVEALNRRATLYFANKGLQQVTRRHPPGAGTRNRAIFGALSGLGIIMQEFGEDKLALEAFRRALAVNPHLPKIPDFVKTLTEKVARAGIFEARVVALRFGRDDRRLKASRRGSLR